MAKKIPAIKKRLKVVKMSELKPYDGNPRHNSESAKVVAQSIEQFGYINPIVVTDKNIVLAGHTRMKALKILKQKEVEVLEVSGLTQKQIDGFVIADNRVGEYSTWNFTAMDKMLGSKKMDKQFMQSIGITTMKENYEFLKKLTGVGNGKKKRT